MRSRAVDKLMHMLKPPGQQTQPGGSKPSSSTTSVTGMGKKLFAEGANFPPSYTLSLSLPARTGSPEGGKLIISHDCMSSDVHVSASRDLEPKLYRVDWVAGKRLVGQYQQGQKPPVDGHAKPPPSHYGNQQAQPQHEQQHYQGQQPQYGQQAPQGYPQQQGGSQWQGGSGY